ncbi:hypothetical protein TOPH_03766 [Tolypocladium ophioglossoides CBS 100239]|uniref:GMP synthase n=1 Tax=Tolypocladium ophioglossoides (strain CBS 100239) TaxID=1163406 RepID=A0A0L0NC63_TOLOC|nr:hypothetical protein TOPH_03766 [Tolypocladium ophioglossoides CBS 100239]
MPELRGLMKGGWHPEKKSGSIRGQVSSLIGRNKDSSSERSQHAARPLTDLKDPSSFAPPPRRSGTAALPPAPPPATTQRKVVAAPSKYQDPRAPDVEPPPKISSERQLGAPPEEDTEQQPRGPYRVNTTGLTTDHLPPPPGRKDGADGRSPPSNDSSVGGTSRPGPPSLPPRLPPRGGSETPQKASPSNTGNGYLNQGAVNRLGAAGVSVPGLGIGRSSPVNASSPSPPPPRPAPGAGAGGRGHNLQVNELQYKFSKMGTSSGSTAAPSPSEGTTWAQKQAAFKTASSFHKDPSSVSLSDAKAAATTANNFRQRHGEHVAAGVNSANNFNQKYGVMDKVGAYAGRQGQGDAATGAIGSTVAVPGLSGKKKPPPPPPKKKPSLGSSTGPVPADDSAPPPIPMSTRPAF